MPGDPKGWHSRGYLPHFDSPERVQHVVFRTADSLPAAVIASLPENPAERRRRADAMLDEGYGSRPLLAEHAASVVATSLTHFDGERYALSAWCVMPNHVHVVLEPSAAERLGDIVRSWKAYTGATLNKMLRRSGAFWARDYFDRYVRDEPHLYQTIAYVEQNPVKAGLVAQADQWRWSSAWRDVSKL